MRDPGSPRTDLPEGLSGQGGQVGLEGGQWALTTRRSLRAHSRFHRQKFFLFFFFSETWVISLLPSLSVGFLEGRALRLASGSPALAPRLAHGACSQQGDVLMDGRVEGPSAIGMLRSEAALGGVSFLYPSDFFSLLEQNPQAPAPCKDRRVRRVSGRTVQSPGFCLGLEAQPTCPARPPA